MNVSELEQKTKETSPFYFTRETMEFFGDTMGNYGVRSALVKTESVWELYRKHPVKYGLKDSAYFDKKTFTRRWK